ncbi:MAG TPA: hypothetical protein VFZ25_10220 [Chloroflexota bacterium]|nr:hypothetical protein [Chloroflexota bacterium]
MAFRHQQRPRRRLPLHSMSIPPGSAFYGPTPMAGYTFLPGYGSWTAGYPAPGEVPAEDSRAGGASFGAFATRPNAPPVGLNQSSEAIHVHIHHHHHHHHHENG